MSDIATVELDLASGLSYAHVVGFSGQAVLYSKLRRDQVLAFFGELQTLSCSDGSVRRRARGFEIGRQ